MSAKKFCVDFDDYCDATIDELDPLVRLKEKHSGFKVTLFTIPKRTTCVALDKIVALNERFGRKWIQLAPHGWRHTRGECLHWTDDETVRKLKLAKKMGIDSPVFRAPAWLLDLDVYEGCKRMNYCVASHQTFRVGHSGVPEYVYNMPETHGVRGVHGHMTPCMDNYIQNMDLFFPQGSKFVYPQDVATCVSV